MAPVDESKEVTPKYVPTGKPRGRPSKAEKAKKAAALIKYMAEHPREPATPYVPTGKPRGRPSKADKDKKVYVPTGKPRGRPKKVKEAAAPE